MVYVLPEPVCPYAKTVTIPLFQTVFKLGATEYLKTSSELLFSANELSKIKSESSIYFVIPSIFTLQSCTINFGFMTDTQSISPRN